MSSSAWRTVRGKYMKCNQNRKFGSLSKIRHWGIAIAVIAVISMGPEAALAVNQVTSIDFKVEGDSSQIEIRADGQIAFEKQENPQDNQLVLELKGAKLGTEASRKLDTSSFNSKVTLISPYQVEGSEDTSRVVVQMRELASADVSQEGNLIRIRVPNNGVALAAASTDAAAPAPADPLADPAAPADPAAAPAEPAAPVQSQALPAKPASSLEDFMANRETKRFSGKAITLQVRDADLVDVFRLIGDTSGFNIIVGDDVRGKISLSLVDVPWDQALDLILHTQRLGAERNNNVLRIVTLANLTKEKQQELQAKLAAEANAPRVTRVFPISYANLGELATMLTKFGTTPQQSSSPSTAQLTVVQPDARTNSIVVRDIPDNIERMKKLIEILDTQTPQILIEAKIVEATEDFGSVFGGSIGIGYQKGNAAALASINGGNFTSTLFSFGSGTSAGTSTVAGSDGTGVFGLGFLPGSARINAVLSMAEEDSVVKVVSSPRTVVLNKETAKIVQSTPVLVPTSGFDTNGNFQRGETMMQANLSLDVVPTVTNDGSVLMQLNIANDVPKTDMIANRNLSTKVIVESGSTLVIGGVYSLNQNKSARGVPLLRKIPLIGWLFGTEEESTIRTELFIFITPRILNEKEAGLSG